MMSEETGSASLSRTRIRRRRWIWIGVAATVALAIGFAVWKVVTTAHYLFEAEERLVLSQVVCDLVAEHVEKSPTHAWPRSWADLESLHPGEGINNWPGGHERVRAMVSVDFKATVADVLKQTPETCTAITVTPGPNYPNIPQRWLIDFYDRLNAVGKGEPGS
jgi:hypothetical protein